MPALPQQDVLPSGAGKDTFVEVCSQCHSTALPMGKQFTRQEWELKITEMLQEEPDVTREERAAILEYLTANFKPGGKIYINKIVAKDLVTLLGISSSAADAIVQYRMTKGEFKNLDEMKSVPGLDIAKIEARKNQLQF
jgi:competence protein ComEA